MTADVHANANAPADANAHASASAYVSTRFVFVKALVARTVDLKGIARPFPVLERIQRFPKRPVFALTRQHDSSLQELEQ